MKKEGISTMMIRKWLAAGLCLTLLCALTACSSSETPDSGAWDWQSLPAAEKTGVTLNVYNWGEYIDETELRTNDAFTHLTGIEVNYKNYDSNEAMYALISSGAASYDVVFPSDYMVGKMISEGLLAKLDFNNIPNYQYIDSKYRNLAYDPQNEYSVPYTWGVVGIFYNSKYVDEADVSQGWDLLWNEKYKGQIYMFDNPRDAFGIALSKLGYSLNTTNEAEIAEAAALLEQQKPLVQGYYMDQIYDKMINEEGWIAPYYNGDMSIMMGEDGNEDIRFFIPEGKTNFFVDAACVLASSQHKTEAEKYIDFLCRTEVALSTAEVIGYSTPHTEARKQLPDSIGGNPLYYPAQDVLDRTEVFLTLPPATNTLLDSWWLKIKQ